MFVAIPNRDNFNRASEPPSRRSMAERHRERGVIPLSESGPTGLGLHLQVRDDIGRHRLREAGGLAQAHGLAAQQLMSSIPILPLYTPPEHNGQK